MQRFFAGQYFDYRQISQLIFNMFSFDQVQLTLDRTNWKWGKRNINILMLGNRLSWNSDTYPLDIA
ncbi:hypothetical protein P639_6926 [Acinetobacter baumannii UH0207]|nr:hypothetical protein P639_6926 [Acinetobacter baumannii UH0207]